MARAQRPGAHPSASRGLPSKAKIAAFIDSAPGPVGRREIARAFQLKAGDRDSLRELLRELRAERGGHMRNGPAKRGGSRAGLPPVGMATVADVDEDGVAHVVPTHDGGAAGAFVLRGLKGQAVSLALAKGDRVLARFIVGEAEDGTGSGRQARLIRKLPGGERRITGIVSGTARGPYWLEPVSKRGRDNVALDPAGTTVRPGDLVTAELAADRRPPTARLVTVHGPASEPGQTSLIAIHEFDIPHVFPSEVLDEAAASTPPAPGERDDLSHFPFVTIDPEDARDHDDAVHAEPDPDPANPAGWIVRVAIADVAHFVRPGSALDREARRRGNSVYFPDRVVTMLPERLSGDLCSLKPGAPRAALVARMVFDRHGVMKRHDFTRASIVSRADLTYSEAQQAIDGAPGERAGGLMESALRPLWQAHGVLAHARGKREPLEIELPERRIVFGADGSPCGVTTPPRLEAHRLIEEFMIQANVASAETLEAREGAFLRRIHDAPAAEKVDALGTYAKSLDLSLPRGQMLTTRLFNRLLDEASATAHGEAVAQAVLRAQSQAFYGPRDRGHFGLNLRRYAHFTSPIRRYADIIVHRALISALALGPDGHDRETIASLDEIGERLSEAERVAMAAERATQDRLVAQFLSARVGATFTGRIAGMVRSGLFVELDETGANGFVASADLGRRHGEYFFADESAFSLSGRDSGLGYRIGERVEVRLTDADPVRGTLDFEMLTPPRALAKTGSSGKTRRRARRARPAG